MYEQRLYIYRYVTFLISGEIILHLVRNSLKYGYQYLISFFVDQFMYVVEWFSLR